MSVAEIKDAVNKLPAQERLRLLAELCDWPDDEWDRQMKNDAAAGKFAGLNEEAAQAAKSGKLKSLEAALAEDWNRPEEDAAWAYLQEGRRS